MYKIRKTKDFERSYKNLQRSGKLTATTQKDINTVINMLGESKSLPQNFKDHKLKGELQQYRECHIKTDLLLIYKIEEKDLILILIDIGSHSHLFQ